MVKHFYLFIALFLLSCSEEHPMSEITAFGTDATLDIITWNIENFPKAATTLEYIQDLILLLNPDIIALQEIESETSFNLLANHLGNDWVGYRYSDSNWGELAYLINLSHINIIEEPYSILEEYEEPIDTLEHYFAYRPPYVLHIEFLDEDGTSNVFKIIDVHFKCCGDGVLDSIDTDDGVLDEDVYWDEEYRRLQANYYLKQYIDEYFIEDKVIILGDFNDELIDTSNVFLNFITDPDYEFADIHIAEGPSSNWSFPNWPSHLDHILLYNNLYSTSTQTLRLDDYIIGGWSKYDNYISDHRPVGISISVD